MHGEADGSHRLPQGWTGTAAESASSPSTADTEFAVCPGVVYCFIRCGSTSRASFREITLQMNAQGYYNQRNVAMLQDIKHVIVWVKRDQLDVTSFIISLYNAQHVSDVNTSIQACDLCVELLHGLPWSGSMCVVVMLWYGCGGVVSVCGLKR